MNNPNIFALLLMFTWILNTAVYLSALHFLLFLLRNCQSVDSAFAKVYCQTLTLYANVVYDLAGNTDPVLVETVQPTATSKATPLNQASNEISRAADRAPLCTAAVEMYSNNSEPSICCPGGWETNPVFQTVQAIPALYFPFTASSDTQWRRWRNIKSPTSRVQLYLRPFGCLLQ